MPVHRVSFSAAAGVVCFVVFLSAPALCTDDADPPCGGGAAHVLRLGVGNEIDTVDPYFYIDPDTYLVTGMIYDSLLRFDNKGNLLPNLAVKWQIGRDLREYTFYLQAGRRFQDGSILTSEDVAYSIARTLWREPALIPVKNAKKMKKGEIGEGLQIIDPNTIKVILDEPDPRFLNVMASHIFGIFPKNKDPRKADPIGSGPMRVRWRNKKGELCLERFAGYNGDRTPQAEAISVKAFTTVDSLIKGFKTGEFDLSRDYTQIIVESGMLPKSVHTFSNPRYYIYHLELGDGNELLRVKRNREILASIFYKVAAKTGNLHSSQSFSPFYFPKGIMPVVYYKRDLPQVAQGECQAFGKKTHRRPLRFMFSDTFYKPAFLQDLVHNFKACDIRYKFDFWTNDERLKLWYAHKGDSHDVVDFPFEDSGETPQGYLDVLPQLPRWGWRHKQLPDAKTLEEMAAARNILDHVERMARLTEVFHRWESDYGFITLFNYRSVYIYNDRIVLPNIDSINFLDLGQIKWKEGDTSK